MIAGAYKADLLADFRGAVEKAITQGKTLEMFRKDFDGIVAKHGWSYNGSRNWRSEVIYSTNIRTSYAAGRWEQLQDPDVKKFYGYLEYRHGDSRVPRPQHLAWNGIILPADDPWWDSHYVPNGWGCKCRVLAATKQDHARALKDGLGKAPPSPIDPKTGEPVGIDKGWGYNVGKAAQAKYKVLESALERLPEDIAQALLGEIEARDKEAAKVARRVRRTVQKKAAPAAGAADDIRLWKKVGEQKGSNPGGLYEAPDKQRYYVKFYTDENQARTEFAANAVYKMLGVEMPELALRDWDGKLALVSRWRTDLKAMKAADMIVHPDDMARIFHASVLTKNWDVVGLEFDNVLVGKNGRLVMIDAGGSFKYRARGGAKAYEAAVDEVKTLRDARMNPQSASVFNAVFGKNVWLEREGAEGLLNLNKAEVKKVFERAGFAKAEAKDLTDTLWKRRQALIDRYDLENRLVPPGFGKHLEEFKKWGVTALSEQEATDSIPLIVRERFEQYIERMFGKEGVSALQRWFNEWSGSSQSVAAGLVKQWTEERLGLNVTYHSGSKGMTARNLARTHAERVSKASKLPRETLFNLLDAEFEFHQYYLRRLHGYEEFSVVREMSKKEMSRTFRNGKYQYGTATCTAYPAGTYRNTEALEITARVEDFIKTWRQGPRYMRFYHAGEYTGKEALPDAGKANGMAEHEYIFLGRPREARIIKKNGSYF